MVWEVGLEGDSLRAGTAGGEVTGDGGPLEGGAMAA